MKKYILIVVGVGFFSPPLMADCKPRSIVCPNGQRAVSSVCGSDLRAALFSCGPTTDMGAFKTFSRL